VLRRLSAEQIWDSLVTLAIPDPDHFMPELDSRLAQIDQMRQVYDNLEARSEEEIMAMVREGAGDYAENYRKTLELTELLNEAVAKKDKARAAEIGREISGLRNESRNALHRMTYGKEIGGGTAERLYDAFGIGGTALPLSAIVEKPPRATSDSAEENARWNEAAKEMVRASELPSPSPLGHFLREFGQSDREEIENAANAASIPQALALLNGPASEVLGNANSVLQKNLRRAGTPAEKIEALFLSVLGRKPGDKERERFLAEIARRGEGAYADLLWVLLNSHQFRFVL
jgi:hypothetical protein